MSRMFRVGLVVLGALSLLDVLGPLLTDGKSPPMGVAIAGSVIGVASLVCIGLAWRGMRKAFFVLAALRLLSAVSALPAFFVSDVPAGIVVAVAAGIILTVVGLVLCMSGTRRTATAAVAQ